MLEFFLVRGFKRYLRQAEKILERNWTGRYTKPSPGLYPHQWNWDSGFIAIGYAHFNQNRAIQEIRSLFEHQWANGMVPQIVFNPEALGNYFPEPDFWQVPDGRLTSGITMPPIHATACLHIYEHGKDKKKAKDFLKEIFPGLMASHRYFYTYRDPHRKGLVYIRHPWESGLDNSPAWDKPLHCIEVDRDRLPSYQRKDLQHGIPAEQRPNDSDYDRYVYLVDLFRRLNYNEENIFAECPFLIQDVLFNSILCRADRDLVEIGRIIGEDVKEAEEWTDMTAKAISELLWSSERQQFDPFDLVQGEHLAAATASSFMPLFALAATTEQAELLYKRFNSVSFCGMRQGNCFTIPNYDMSREDFDPKNYWRGPVWVNINWMLSHGLKNYGYREKSDFMKKDMIQLPIRFGFHEYFDSISGKGYGSHSFSWTASLFIDLVYEYYEQDEISMIWNRSKAQKLKKHLILNEIDVEETVHREDLASRLMASINDLKGAFYDIKRGLVDYRAMRISPEYAAYKRLSAHLKAFELESLATKEEKLAFWINLYNTIVVQGIIEMDITSSVKEVSDFFKEICYWIGGHAFSTDEIEHGILRCNARQPYHLFPLFKKNDPRLKFILGELDPRIHFALVCGSRSCAPIRFYEADLIDRQLETATKGFINSSEVVILPEQNKILLSQIFKWYAKDFGKKEDLFIFLIRYLDECKNAEYLAENIDTIKTEYLYYDWNLNH